MNTVYTWEIDENTRIVAVFDEHYETRGSYAYDTEEETRAAEDEELRRLASGDLAVYGFKREEKCAHCGEWQCTDSIWGCVTVNTEEEAKAFAMEYLA